MIAFLMRFILSPYGILSIIGLAFLLSSGIYLKGRHDGKYAYKLAIQGEITDAIRQGQKARADALKRFDANRLSESWVFD